MNDGQIIETKYRSGKFGSVVIKSVDETLAAKMPQLRLPSMGDEARSAFRNVIAYEVPPANGSLADFLALAEARGYSAHPCDWIPEFNWLYAGRHPRMYQPWTDFLSEHGYTKFHGGNTLTADNWKRFSPGQRHGPLKARIVEGREDDFATVKSIAGAHAASVRAEIVGAVYAWGSFNGCYPWQVPLLEYFAHDPSDKVRAIALDKLDKMGKFTTPEAHARVIADELVVTAETVTYRNPPEHPSGFLFIPFMCATFDSLAQALGLTTRQLAERADLEAFRMGNFSILVALSADLEARSILATRALDMGRGGESMSLSWFDGVEPGLWRRGLEAMKASPYSNSVQEYLGDKTGTMSLAELLEWDAWEHMRQSVTRQIKERKLPVNIMYDPLRYLAKIVDKQAAQAILDEAIGLGMKPDNPRLTMLRFNLAL